MLQAAIATPAMPHAKLRQKPKHKPCNTSSKSSRKQRMPKKPTMNDLIDYLWAWRKIASRAATKTANAANEALHQYCLRRESAAARRLQFALPALDGYSVIERATRAERSAA